MKVEITKDTFGFWKFTIIGGNNQVIANSSNGYTLAEGLSGADIVVPA